MSARQSRAARAWLGWSQADLAKEAGCGTRTVMDFERDARNTATGSQALMRMAFEREGVEFVDGGLRLKEKPRTRRGS